MTENVDYFSNHRLKLRFPWSLYHQPILNELERALRAPGETVLNLGSGPFFELRELPRVDKRFTVCDIDPRAVALARRLHGPAIVRADVVEPDGPLPYGDATFDLLVSMDVVEHVPEPLPWLREALRVVKPGGSLFFTTPNYASRSLKILESTVLEVVARAQGFSRRALHPTKLDSESLTRLFTAAGASDARVKAIARGWVLAATVRR